MGVEKNAVNEFSQFNRGFNNDSSYGVNWYLEFVANLHLSRTYGQTVGQFRYGSAGEQQNSISSNPVLDNSTWTARKSHLNIVICACQIYLSLIAL